MIHSYSNTSLFLFLFCFSKVPTVQHMGTATVLDNIDKPEPSAP